MEKSQYYCTLNRDQQTVQVDIDRPYCNPRKIQKLLCKQFFHLRYYTYHLHHSLSKSSYEHCTMNKLTILHQNIRGISNKIDEFLNSVFPNAPQVICLTEHHLRMEEVRNVNFGQYTLGASFCRQTYSRGGVCVFVPKNIQFYAIYLDQYNKEKDLETCALKLNILSNSFIIICIYRSPTCNFSYFLNQLE